MSAASTAIVLELLRQYSPADVPGYARQTHDLIVSHERVREIHASTLADPAARRTRMKRPLPQGVPEEFSKHAAVEVNAALAHRFKVSTATITRWRREAAIGPADHRTRPIPKTFYLFAPQTTRYQLSRHYEVSTDTVDRWLKESGLTAKRNIPGSVAWGYKATPSHTARDDSVVGRAAYFLQRLTQVHRCDDDGRANPGGRWWRFGRVVLTGEALVERATRSGWDADAWRRIPGQPLPDGEPPCA